MVRPPPESSAYHAENPLYEGVLDRLAGTEHVQAVVIPRTEGQRRSMAERRRANLIVPEQAVDTQSLIALCDLVVGAGGTMNREAVALGTSVYTIFSGRTGAVDQRLIAEGCLRPLGSAEELELRKRDTEPGVRSPRDPELLVDGILGALDS